MTKNELEAVAYHLRIFMMYYNDTVDGLSYSSETVESRMIEQGIQRQKKNDSWMSNKETIVRKPITPFYITDSTMKKFNRAYNGLPEQVQKFVKLKYSVDDSGREWLDKEVQYALGFRNRMTWTRRKKQWHQLIFNTFRNWRLI